MGKFLNLRLIDFGLSKKYLNNDGSHVEKTRDKNFSGNLPFASVNMCRQFRASRRDDFEAVFYFMVFLLNEYKLPWDDLLDTSMFNRNVGQAIDCYMS